MPWIPAPPHGPEFTSRHFRCPAHRLTGGVQLDTPVFKEWLETAVKKQSVSYESASDWCKAYPVKSSRHYEELKRQDELRARFPWNPQVVYVGHGWSDWWTFLGKDRMWTYEKCKQYVMSIPEEKRPKNKI